VLAVLAFARRWKNLSKWRRRAVKTKCPKTLAGKLESMALKVKSTMKALFFSIKNILQAGKRSRSSVCGILWIKVTAEAYSYYIRFLRIRGILLVDASFLEKKNSRWALKAWTPRLLQRKHYTNSVKDDGSWKSIGDLDRKRRRWRSRLAFFEMLAYSPEELIQKSEKHSLGARRNASKASNDLRFLGHDWGRRFGDGEGKPYFRKEEWPADGDSFWPEGSYDYVESNDLITVPCCWLKRLGGRYMIPQSGRTSEVRSFWVVWVIQIAYPTSEWCFEDKMMSMRGELIPISLGRTGGSNELIPGQSFASSYESTLHDSPQDLSTPFGTEGWGVLYWGVCTLRIRGTFPVMQKIKVSECCFGGECNRSCTELFSHWITFGEIWLSTGVHRICWWTTLVIWAGQMRRREVRRSFWGEFMGHLYSDSLIWLVLGNLMPLRIEDGGIQVKWERRNSWFWSWKQKHHADRILRGKSPEISLKEGLHRAIGGDFFWIKFNWRKCSPRLAQKKGPQISRRFEFLAFNSVKIGRETFKMDRSICNLLNQ